MSTPDRNDSLHEYWVEVIEDLYHLPVVVPVLFRMNCDEYPSVRPNIQRLRGYVPGKQPAGDGWIKLNRRVTLYELLDLPRLKKIVDGGA